MKDDNLTLDDLAMLSIALEETDIPMLQNHRQYNTTVRRFKASYMAASTKVEESKRTASDKRRQKAVRFKIVAV